MPNLSAAEVKLLDTDGPVLLEHLLVCTQAIYLYANGELHLDRLDFSRMVHGLCAAVDMVPEAMMDLLIILAAMDDRPADEMMFLVWPSLLRVIKLQRLSSHVLLESNQGDWRDQCAAWLHFGM